MKLTSLMKPTLKGRLVDWADLDMALKNFTNVIYFEGRVRCVHDAPFDILFIKNDQDVANIYVFCSRAPRSDRIERKWTARFNSKLSKPVRLVFT